MQDQKLNIRFAVVTGMILVAALFRIFPHPLNFSPVAAMGLFGAAYFSKRWLAFLVPVLAVFASDIIINNVIYAHYFEGFTVFYEGFFWQYGSYLLIVLFGLGVLSKVTLPRILGGAIGAGAIFFLVSNFGVWLGSPMYPQNIGGLMACYGAGWPFYQATFAGDLIFTGVMFGAYEFIKLRYPALDFQTQRIA
ncbi:DUF6580 family putative transport protein [Phaeodactylibacter sp.]|jgi:hypothetical protein|uniref:DUF6580 family putative transport protein n=1 Tax=Phaeodactylibacter sp. TaxID=1940289 RepID=UPI0025E087B4|nr:DUF6580 family putative transport protein [Phaeodactylibacter sp.]MCI4649059.1 hypothetical protein [Phaeodactylibacter sp.]MCI5091777.1 hypothetical protein [Phaeodactylibacter sp.]